MYTYKCYFHPKEDSVQSCKGCKLPTCADCNDGEGFCPDCQERRAAVHQLKQLRNAVAANAHVAASTTARLRLARRQMAAEGPSQPQPQRRSAKLRRKPPSKPLPSDIVMSGAVTRPLRDLAGQKSAALAEDGAIARQIRDRLERSAPAPRPAASAPQPRRYNPEVAYKAPAAYSERKIIRKAARPEPAKSFSLESLPPWVLPFATGLGIGLVILLVLVAFQGHSPRHVSSLKSRLPHIAQLSNKEAALMDRLLHTQRVEAEELAPARTAAPVETHVVQPVRQAAPVAPAQAAPIVMPRGHRAESSKDTIIHFDRAPAEATAHVALAWPRSGARLGALQYVKANIGAPQRLSSVVLLVDGQPFTSTTSVAGQTEVALDTTQLANGVHTLQLQGYTWQDVAARSASVRIRVVN